MDFAYLSRAKSTKNQNMKRYSTLLLLILITQLCISQVTFKKTFNITGKDYGGSVIETKDGNYLVFGASYDDPGGNNYFLLKTDLYGNSLWVKKFPGDFAASVNTTQTLLETSDSGYLFTTASSYKLNLIKTDKNGDTLWTVKYPEFRYAAIQPTPDGGFILFGNDTANKITLIKTDQNGLPEWKKRYLIGGDSLYFFDYHSVKQLRDGGYILSGTFSNVPTFWTTEYIFLMKVSSTGDSLWYKKYSNVSMQASTAVQETPDNGFIIGGNLDSNGTNTHFNGYVLKLNAAGDTLWTKVYGGSGNQYFEAFEPTSDGGYIAVGASQEPSQLFYVLYLVRMNAAGDTLWTKYYPEAGTDIGGYSIRQTRENGFIICGGIGNQDTDGKVLLMKTDSNGETFPEGISETNGSSLLEIFPNPTTGKFFLNPPGKFSEAEISDLYGRIILRKELNPNLNSTLIFDLTGKPKGVYLVKLKNSGSVLAGRVILN